MRRGLISAPCGDPAQEFVRDVTSGRRFQQKEPTMTLRVGSKEPSEKSELIYQEGSEEDALGCPWAHWSCIASGCGSVDCDDAMAGI
jgi:hypothetical protein